MRAIETRGRKLLYGQGVPSQAVKKGLSNQCNVQCAGARPRCTLQNEGGRILGASKGAAGSYTLTH
jgi:hypothetical protein